MNDTVVMKETDTLTDITLPNAPACLHTESSRAASKARGNIREELCALLVHTPITVMSELIALDTEEEALKALDEITNPKQKNKYGLVDSECGELVKKRGYYSFDCSNLSVEQQQRLMHCIEKLTGILEPSTGHHPYGSKHISGDRIDYIIEEKGTYAYFADEIGILSNKAPSTLLDKDDQSLLPTADNALQAWNNPGNVLYFNYHPTPLVTHNKITSHEYPAISYRT